MGLQRLTFGPLPNGCSPFKDPDIRGLQYVICGSGHPFRLAFEQFRHKHYCERLGYEHECQDGRETDWRDLHSVYIIVLLYGIIVGGARVLRKKPGSTRLLPFEDELNKAGITFDATEVECEISRYLVPEVLDSGKYTCLLNRGICHYLEGEGVRIAHAVVNPLFYVKLERKYPGQAFQKIGGTPFQVMRRKNVLTHIGTRIEVDEWSKHFEPVPFFRVGSYTQRLLAA